MILLDTNVLSELMRPRPEARVVQWLDTHNRPVHDMFPFHFSTFIFEGGISEA